MSDSDKKVQCVRCFRIQPEKDKFCTGCGAPLHNKCTNKSSPLHKACESKNEPDAAYCAKCGSPTTFNEAGLI